MRDPFPLPAHSTTLTEATRKEVTQMSQTTTRGRKIALIGIAAALSAAAVVPTAVGAQDEMADAMVRYVTVKRDNKNLEKALNTPH